MQFDTLCNHGREFLYLREVAPQTYAEAPHSEPEEYAQRQEKSCGKAQTAGVEGARVGVGHEDGVFA